MYLIRQSVYLVGLISFALAASAATVTVTPTVTILGGLYHYNYSVTNGGLIDLSDIELNVAPGSGTVKNLVSPTGFSAFFDPGLGLVDFVEGAQAFTAGMTFRGFAFDSALSPVSSNFSAVGLDAGQNLVSMTGITLAPGLAAIPEPGSWTLLGTGAFLLFPFLRRRGTKTKV